MAFWLSFFVTVAVCTFVMTGLAGLDRRGVSDSGRIRVNWQRVYEMEREVWGQTFEHAGAPPYRWGSDKMIVRNDDVFESRAVRRLRENEVRNTEWDRLQQTIDAVDHRLTSTLAPPNGQYMSELSELRAQTERQMKELVIYGDHRQEG